MYLATLSKVHISAERRRKQKIFMFRKR